MNNFTMFACSKIILLFISVKIMIIGSSFLQSLSANSTKPWVSCGVCVFAAIMSLGGCQFVETNIEKLISTVCAQHTVLS